MLSFAIQPAEPVMFVDAVAGAVESIAVFAEQKISFVVSEFCFISKIYNFWNVLHIPVDFAAQ